MYSIRTRRTDGALMDSEKRIARWMSRLTPSTRIQYRVYVRGLRAAIKSKRIEDASPADVLRYLRGLQSEWMRRRGLSALRGCFAALTERGTADPTRGITVSALRGGSRRVRAREVLRRRGWSAQDRGGHVGRARSGRVRRPFVYARDARRARRPARRGLSRKDAGGRVRAARGPACVRGSNASPPHAAPR